MKIQLKLSSQIEPCTSVPPKCNGTRFSYVFSAFNPNGIASSSPGLRGTSYPGLEQRPSQNPEGVPPRTLNRYTAWVHRFILPIFQSPRVGILNAASLPDGHAAASRSRIGRERSSMSAAVPRASGEKTLPEPLCPFCHLPSSILVSLSNELRFLLRETKVWIAKGWNRAATKTALN